MLGGVDVTGLAPAAATITINSSTSGVARFADYYFKGLTVTNTSLPVWQSVAVSSSLGGSATRNAFVAQTPEAFTYDLDGNILTDGRWSRSYDAENRLIAMEAVAAAYGAGAPRQKIEFRYDALGRTIGKKVYSYSGGWTLDFERRFVYDGWQMIAELSASGSATTLLRTYAWGLDLTGTLHGAGGVGGLLLAKGQFWDSSTAQNVTTTLLPAYDGNGNVMGMVRTSDGALAVAFEYDAFGRTVRATGDLAKDALFRFSTKWTDTETGELNYGRRRYDPSTGRFTTRDPIQEKGGLNLYAFVLNNPVTRWDYRGMFPRFMQWHRPFLLDGGGGNDEKPIELEKFVIKEPRNTPEELARMIEVLAPTIHARIELSNRKKAGAKKDGKGSKDSTKEKWEPNKENCAQLITALGRFIGASPGAIGGDPGSQFEDSDAAHVAGLIAAMRQSIVDGTFGTSRIEYGGYVFLSGFNNDGQALFSYSPVQQGGRPGVTDIEFPRGIGLRSDGILGSMPDYHIQGFYHTHPVGAIPNTFSAGALPSDADYVSTYRASLTMLDFGTGRIGEISENRLSSPTQIQGDPGGRTLTGLGDLPTDSEIQQIAQCAQAGHL